MIALEPRGGALAAEVIHAETVLGSEFPEPFRSWLLSTGGGEVYPEVPMPGPDGEALLEELLSPESIASTYGRDFAVSVPSRCVVVGYGGGGAVALCLEGDDRGRVYFADCDKAIELWDEGVLETEGEPTEEIMTELAPGWDEFLASR